MLVRENILLKDYTTMRVGGPARFFVTVSDDNELLSAVLFAKEKSLPFFILGEGSNIIVSDEGLQSVVILMRTSGVFFKAEGARVFVTAAAGESWDALVNETVKLGLFGLENLSLIPGTVGAAPVQNIGAYGQEVKNVIQKVDVLDTEIMQKKVLSKEECGFGYRSSVFKKPEAKNLVITGVTLVLKTNGVPDTSYRGVKEYLHERGITNPSLPQMRESIIAIRRAKLPYPDEVGTVGSFFKNPFVSKDFYIGLQKQFPDVPGFEGADGRVKVPAAWLIDHACGLKGVRKGNVGTYDTQPLAIVHYGGGVAREIKNFAEDVRKLVFEKTKIKLEYEVSFIGVFQ